MLSYRHLYHAGNHADVLKHFCLYHVLSYYNRKPKPYLYIDTHAGAAMYNLNSEEANLNREFSRGIKRLQENKKEQLVEPLQEFIDFVTHQAFLPSSAYLGSAAIAALLLRQGDQMRLFERHPQDAKLLEENIPLLAPKARTFITNGDGYKGLIASLPPHTRRCVTLIDPSYEMKEEYTELPHYVQEAMQRFPQGCYIIWSPQLSRHEAKQLPKQLKSMVSENYLHVSLSVSNPCADGFGMFGSQLFIINPPYILPSILESSLSQMVKLLGQDDNASYELDYHLT